MSGIGNADHLDVNVLIGCFRYLSKISTFSTNVVAAALADLVARRQCRLMSVLMWRRPPRLGLVAAGDTYCCMPTWPFGDCLQRLASKGACPRIFGACCKQLLHPEQPPSKRVEVSVFSGRPRHRLSRHCSAAPVATGFGGDATFCQAHVDNPSSSLLARRSPLGLAPRASLYGEPARTFYNLL
ncbi:hypothetical protein HPB51_009496 [Rhipicephalus microplus]|uniref:Uncharacterized protein n=1 Tax=Rhipicephalus microplus TaxID=6941 RepID=A0A9J6D920_RHIMP|nr:hypothetical protein HPB51_009496 [Rhipicephalus microplus]